SSALGRSGVSCYPPCDDHLFPDRCFAARVPLRAQSLRVVVSDLLFAGDPQPLASALTVRQGRALVFVPFCQGETDPDWDGNMEFIEAEAQSHHPRRVEPALLKRYRAAYVRHFELWKAAALRCGV